MTTTKLADATTLAQRLPRRVIPKLSECPMTSPNLPITIRLAAQDDHLSLDRLAPLDSTEDVPAGRVMLLSDTLGGDGEGVERHRGW